MKPCMKHTHTHTNARTHAQTHTHTHPWQLCVCSWVCDANVCLLSCISDFMGGGVVHAAGRRTMLLFTEYVYGEYVLWTLWIWISSSPWCCSIWAENVLLSQTIPHNWHPVSLCLCVCVCVCACACACVCVCVSEGACFTTLDSHGVLESE